MTIDSEALPGDITKINLAGRLDIAGAQEIDLRFTSLIALVRTSAVVDLAGVIFLASIGIRTLITNAKALKRRGGLMVLVNPQPMVAEVLEATGVSEILPVFADLASATEALARPRAPQA